MSEQKFSVDDILEELKQQETQQKQQAYQQARRYDTQSLLNEILGDHSAAHSESVPSKPAVEQPSGSLSTEPPAPHFAAEDSKPSQAESQMPPVPAPEEVKPRPQEDRFTLDEEALRKHQEEQGNLRSPLWRTQEFGVTPSKTQPTEEAQAEKAKSSAVSSEAERLAQRAEEYDTFRRRREEMIQGFTLKTPPHLEEGQQMPVSSPESLEPTQPVGLSKERTEILQEKLKQFHTGQTGEMNRAQAPKEDTKEIPKGKLDSFVQMHSKESGREEEEEQSPLPEKEETIADGDYEFEEFTSLDQADEFAGAFKKTFHRGVWKLVGLAVVFLISLGFSLLGNLEGTPLEEFGPMVPCIAQLVCAVLGFGLALDRMKNGFVTLRPSKASRDSLISLAMVMVIVFSVVLLVVDPQALQASGVYLYVPVVLFELLFGAIGRLMEYRAIITNFKVVSAPAQYDKYSVTIEKNQSLAEDLVRPGGLEERAWMAESRKADFLTGFVKESLGNQFGDKTVKVTTPIFLILSLLAGVLSFFLGDIYTAFTVFTGSLAVSAGAIGLFLTAFPLYTTAKTLSRMGGAVLGGRAMEQFEGVNSLVLDAADLFYPKNITLYGIKTFSNMPIDHAILDATSVLCRTKSVLGCVFLKIIGNHTNYLSPVDSISYEDGMGISAWVNDRRILIGSRELMIHHGIDVPSKDYENRYLEQNRNLVYLSASGELSGVFVLGLGYSEDIRNMLIDLYNNNVLAVVRTVDPILTQQRLAQIFDLPLETFAVVPSRLSKELDASLEPAQTAPALVCHNGRLASQIYSVLCAKVLGRPIHAGRWLYLISAGLGVALFVLFTLLGGVGQISNLFLCIYELISALLCLGVQYAGRLK